MATDIGWKVIIPLAVLLSCLSNIAMGSAAKLPATATPTFPPEIFNTLEFRGDLRALPHWLATIADAHKQLHDFQTCQSSKSCSPEALSWHKMEANAQNLQGIAKLRWVNAFFNRWPYRSDIETYKRSDYWATPKEFLKYSGDCEDYSIAKYFALKTLGYPIDHLRIVVLKDSIRNSGHAILAVYTEETIYILDSLSDLVLPHSFYQHYIPQYSVNEEFRWAHIPRAKHISRFQHQSKDIANDK